MAIGQRKGIWRGRFQSDGHRKQVVLRDWNDGKEPASKKEAQAVFEKFCTAIRTGKAFAPRNVDRTMSIGQYVEYYKEHYFDMEDRSGEGDKAILSVVGQHFGNDPLKTWSNPHTFRAFYKWLKVTPISVTIRSKNDQGEWVVTKRDGTKLRSAKTLSTYKLRVAHMVKKAVTWDLLDANPFDKDEDLMGSIVKSEGRSRGVSAQEEAALLLASDELPEEGIAMRERIEIAIALGMRRGEMQRAQLKDIDFDEWLWKFPAFKLIGEKKVRNTKSHKAGQVNGRTIPIPGSLQPFFKSKRRTFGLNGDAFLFGDKDGHYVQSFKSAWALVKKKAKLSDARMEAAGKVALHWHDLRGEAGTRMLNDGVAPATVADILGNTVEVLLKHYKGDLMKSMRAAAVKMDAR